MVEFLEQLILGYLAIQILIAFAPAMSTPEFPHNLSLVLKIFGF